LASATSRRVSTRAWSLASWILEARLSTVSSIAGAFAARSTFRAIQSSLSTIARFLTDEAAAQQAFADLRWPKVHSPLE
jgi:hypothetical protein